MMTTVTDTATHNHNSTAMSANVNLYCAQCESQIGIFYNEWIRLTSSYARSKERGTHFGTEVGSRTQVVPSGPAQRSAEGCVMAEVFCRKCSNMVGQYCKSAPDIEKQPLAGQYFYKLSRTFLKDSRTNVKIEPVFGYGNDVVKPPSSQSSVAPRLSMTPTSKWATTPLRQSSRTPAISAQGTNRGSTRHDSQATPVSVAELPREDRLKQTTAEIAKLREEMFSHQSMIFRQAGEISAHTTKLEIQETRLRDQQAEIKEYEHFQSAQAARIVEQDQTIQFQTKTIKEQGAVLSTITNQLNKLQKTMDDLKQAILTTKYDTPIQSSVASHIFDLDTSETIASNGSNTSELQALRVQNQAMKSRLKTIASTMSTTATISTSSNVDRNLSPCTTSKAINTLGKRKRVEADVLPPSDTGIRTSVRVNAVASSANHVEQMPTPQSSDEGQRSLENTPSNVDVQPGNKRRSTRRTANVGQNGVASDALNQPPSDTHDTAQAALPSVQAAGNVLGMNLEALIASSQALTKQTELEDLKLDVEPTETLTRPENPAHALNSALQVGESAGDSLDSLPDSFEFEQDFDFHEIIDASDDDDDYVPLDTTSYGDGAVEADAASSSELDEAALTQPASQGRSRRVTAPPVIRQNRSTAPEPKKGNSKHSTVGRHVSMEGAHVATPTASANTFTVGTVQLPPETELPSGVPTRERMLNEELLQLGLSHWIGKKKKTKEFRLAVNAARDRLRNSKKAAFLLSKGLRYDPSDPSASLPGGCDIVQQEDTQDTQDMPLLNRENVPAPVPIEASAVSVLDDDQEQNREAAKSSSRATRTTRASTRRSSGRLVPGLEEAESQKADGEDRPVSRKRKSDGRRRRSNRRSEAAPIGDKPSDAVHLDNDEDQPNVDEQAGQATTTTTEETGSTQSKPSTKPRGRPRKSATSALVVDSISQDKDTDDNLEEATDPQSISMQAAEDGDSNDKASRMQTSNTKGQTQQEREEAIRLRDRMAKELMELEDLDM